ncbi:MAG: protein translocase subunit SecF [Candidatus Liptonbacteria bacterium]
MNIVGRKSIYLSVSGILVLAAILAIGIWGFKEGIDFKGGALLSFSANVNSDQAQIIQSIFVNDLKLGDTRVNYDSQNNNFLARLPEVDEANHQKITIELTNKLPKYEELSFQSIGPSVGAALKNSSIIALILVLVGISLYIAFAFRKVFRPISSWKYGWITLLTLFHDVLIPAGLLAVLGHYKGIEIDGNFVVALLVVMGFSVHDTIVVFDRIRENLLLDRGKSDFGTVINTSVNQTIARSINTSLTLILVLLALYFVGPVTLKFFILTLLVGVTTGIYSSIFVASPLLHLWQHGVRSRTI